MNIKLIILLLSLMCCEVLLAQFTGVNSKATMVIANGGLRLREGPSKNSKTLAIIPFGTTIKYVDDSSHGSDSVSIESEIKDINKTIYGYWVKIINGQQVGYVLDIFLDMKIEGRFDNSVDNEFKLLYPGCGCDQSNIHNPEKWKWYGYFQATEDKLVSRKIDISYYRTRDYTCDLMINPSETKDLLFIIGSKSKTLNKEIKVLAKDMYLTDWKGNKASQEELKKYELELQKQSTEEGRIADILYLKRDGSKSVLSKKEFDYPNKVKLIGDIDGDSLNDYIIHYGDKGSILVLYLSTAAKGQELLKAVALFYAGYCC